MIRKLIGFIIKIRIIALIAMILITGFFATQITHMEMFTQFLDLFPANHSYVKTHKRYAKYFGGAYQATLMLEVKHGDVFNFETLKKMQQIQYDVDLIPGVDHFAIYSIASPKVYFTRETPQGFSTKQIMVDVPKNEQELAELKRKVFTSPTINGSYVSLDRKALRLDANFIEGRIDFNELFNEFVKLKEREEDANHTIHISGMPILGT